MEWLVEVFDIGVTDKFSCSIKLDVVGESLVDDGPGPGVDDNAAVLVGISFYFLIALGFNGCMPVDLNLLIVIFIFIAASNASLKITAKFVLLIVTFLS